MGLFDKVKKAADQAQQVARTVKTELESHGIEVGGDEARQRREAEEQEAQREQYGRDLNDYLGFDPFSLLTDEQVSDAVGFAVAQSGQGGGDYEVGPSYRATGKNDDRTVSVCFLYPEDLRGADWDAAEQAEFYATVSDEPLAEWNDIGDRAWLVTEEMIVVLVRGRVFYIYSGGERPSRPTTAGLKQLASIVANAVPVMH